MSSQLTIYRDEPFLVSVAKKILARHDQQMAHVHVILPTRRACLHFKHHLATLKEEAFIAPQVLSINDFIFKATGILPASPLDLILDLHQEFVKFNEMSLTDFVGLGKAMLEDYALIERNLDQRRAAKFFTWLQQAKAIDRWAEELGQDPVISPKTQAYLNFWDGFHLSYKSLRKRLKEQKKGFSALVYRTFLDNFDLLKEAGVFSFVNWVGFNQLTEVEIKIIERTTKEGCGATFWDFDAFYTQKPKRGHDASAHEAGFYFRLLQEKKLFYNSPNFVKDLIRTQAKTIDVWAVPNRSTQANKAAELVEKLVAAEPDFGEKINFAAILLPDETLLEPLLRCLKPEISSQVNITMGLPIGQSQSFRLIKLLFQLQRNVSPQGFKASDVFELLTHPFFLHRELSESFKQQARNLRELTYNQVRISSLDVEEMPELVPFFSIWSSGIQSYAQRLRHLIEILSKPLSQRAYLENIEKEFCYRIYQAIVELEKRIGQESIALFEQMLEDVTGSETVPFSGQPLAPIQIMGLLESRTLDFDHIIVLSCNEGTLPKSKKLDSVIPFELKKIYHLQTHNEQDSAIAYTFYRLLQRCKSANYIYDNSNNKGESRFLRQIEIELDQIAQIQFSHHKLSLPQPCQHNSSFRIEKTGEVIEKIRAKLESGISPSSLNRYLQNPLQFYIADVLGLKPIADLDENLDSATFGTLVHGALKLIFEPFLGKIPAGLEKITTAQIEQILYQVMRDTYNALQLNEGKNYLLVKTAALLLENFFKSDAQSAEKLLALELSLSTQLPSQQANIKIHGIIDRIDLQHNLLKIKDYKTGGFYEKELKITHWHDMLTQQDKGKVLQMLVYKYIMVKNLRSNQIKETVFEELAGHEMRIEAGFYFLKNKKRGFVAYAFEKEPKDNQQFIDEAESFLLQIFDQMLDPNLPLTQEPVCKGFSALESE